MSKVITDTVQTRLQTRRMLKMIPAWGWQMLIALVIYIAITAIILQANPGLDLRVRISLEPLMAASTWVQIHVGAALTTFAVGLGLLSAPKGFRFHKTAGWFWVVSMAITALSSFFITGLMGASYSPIHALSAWTMIGLPFGVAAIRRKDIKKHRHTMTNMFVGGMVIAGLFSFLPGRTMWAIFFAA